MNGSFHESFRERWWRRCFEAGPGSLGRCRLYNIINDHPPLGTREHSAGCADLRTALSSAQPEIRNQSPSQGSSIVDRLPRPKRRS